MSRESELKAEMQAFQSSRANEIRKEALEMLKRAAASREHASGKGDQRRPSSQGSKGAR